MKKIPIMVIFGSIAYVLQAHKHLFFVQLKTMKRHFIRKSIYYVEKGD